MKSVKISILVPIYNVEKYLKRCVDSVLAQNFSDWELILVDDGSPDNSGKICDWYAQQNSRILVVHKKNGGLPSARLAGFRVAKGDYLIFLDGDDTLLPGALEKLCHAIESDGGYDIVKTKVCRVNSNGETWTESYLVDEGVVIGEGKFLSLMQGDAVSPYLHSGIYRKSLFSENVFYPLVDFHISVGEDWFVNYYISTQVSKVKFLSYSTFAYYVNEDSMMAGNVYGWEYYERIEQCKKRINKEIGVEESDEYLAKKALLDLRYFFFPEVPFSWMEFHKIQPRALLGLRLQKQGKKSSYNPKFTHFLSVGWLFYLYTLFFRGCFLLFKLKGKKRKVIR